MKGSHGIVALSIRTLQRGTIMKNFKLVRIASILAIFALALGLAACNNDKGKGTIGLDTLEEVSGVKVTCENAGKDQEAISAGAIVVDKGDHICISPDFTQGGVHLTIVSSSGKTTAFDGDVNGRQLFTVEAKAGQYDVKVTGNGATGSMTVFAENKEEAAKINEDLEKASKDAQEKADKANEELKDDIAEANKIADEVSKDVEEATK